jgi:hypothetical protein
VDESVPSVTFDPSKTPDERTDHVALTARLGGDQMGQVTLHVVHGRLFELEVWAGYGVRPRVQVEELTYV